MFDIFKSYLSEYQLEQAEVFRLEQSLILRNKFIDKLEQSLQHQTSANIKLINEIHDIKEELAVYVEMQDNLNTALGGNPELLDYIEALQCGGDTAEMLDIAKTYDSAFYGLIKHNEHITKQLETAEQYIEEGGTVLLLYISGLRRCHAAYMAAITEAQDYRENSDKWQTAYNNLK